MYTLSKVIIPDEDDFTVQLPGTATVLRVVDEGDNLAVYALVEPGEPDVPQVFKFVRVGDTVPHEYQKYAGIIDRNGEPQALFGWGPQVIGGGA